MYIVCACVVCNTILQYCCARACPQAMNQKERGDQVISSSKKLFDESILYIHTYYTKNHTSVLNIPRTQTQTETDNIRDTDIGHQEHKSFE